MGPKIVPCGTPGLMVVNLDLTLPIFTRCLRWYKKDVGHSFIKFRQAKRRTFSQQNMVVYSTSRTRIMVPLELSAAFHLCTSSISACTVDVPLTDPNCWGSTCSPAMVVIQAQMKCSKHFDNTGVSDIGRRSL